MPSCNDHHFGRLFLPHPGMLEIGRERERSASAISPDSNAHEPPTRPRAWAIQVPFQLPDAVWTEVSLSPENWKV